VRKCLRTQPYEIRFDTRFEEVIYRCATVERKGLEGGTWITQQVQTAYTKLHQLGYAHSVEVYDSDKLVGSLYGIALGKVFYGESMFHLVPNASKIALVALVVQLRYWEYELIDNQQTTPLLIQFGAEEIDREYFLELLGNAATKKGITGRWFTNGEYDIQAMIQEALIHP